MIGEEATEMRRGIGGVGLNTAPSPRKTNRTIEMISQPPNSSAVITITTAKSTRVVMSSAKIITHQS